MSSVARPRESFGARLIKNIRQRPAIYVMLLFVVAAFIIFAYVPMGGLIIAFQKYAPRLGIAGSKWVGFKWFLEFFNDMFFFRLIRNTFTINLLDILVGFPMPILLAVMMNALRSRRAKATLQTMMYLPYFISMIVICGIISDFCARDGIINDLIAAFGGQRMGLLDRKSVV